MNELIFNDLDKLPVNQTKQIIKYSNLFSNFYIMILKGAEKVGNNHIA